MDKLDLAIRRYKQILPEPVEFVQGSARHKLQVWLTDDVCPAIEGYVRRPAFRDHATWVLRTIVPGANTRERHEIDVAEQALCRCAIALTKLAAKARVHNRLTALYPPEPQVAVQEVRVSSRGARRLALEHAPVDVLGIELSQVAAIAERPWTDLVKVDDYFEPQQEIVKADDDQAIQRGEFIVSLNPELHPVGNFVVRCMFRRLDLMLESVSAVRSKVSRAVRATGQKYIGLGEIDEAWKALQTGHAALRNSYMTGPDNSMRDSCMILTQIYAAFAPSPELDWLRVSTESARDAVGKLRHRLTHYQNAEMFERIAAALGDVKRLYMGRSPQQSEKEEAIATGGLVIDAQALEVFWDHQLVDANWRRFQKPWDFALALARQAKHNGDVTESDVYGDEVISASAMATVAQRLKALLPPVFRKLIVPGKTPRSYRLDLSPHQIHVFT